MDLPGAARWRGVLREVLSPVLVGETEKSSSSLACFLVGLRFFGLGVVGSSLLVVAFFLGDARFFGEGDLGSLIAAPPFFVVLDFLEGEGSDAADS